MKDASRHIFDVIAIALSLLLLLSAVPWSSITGNKVKDFNLFEDLMPAGRSKSVAQAVETDPELENFLAEEEALDADNLPSEPLAEVSEEQPQQPLPVESEEAPRGENGEVLLESYSATPLGHFKAALSAGSARVAVLGDSFIEGDIFTQDLRRLLQEAYGGQGVGYMALHNDFPGFRNSVQQTDAGWTRHDLRAIGSHDTIRTISGEYSKADAAASTTFRGARKNPRLASWDRSLLLFISPDSGTITLTTDAGPQSHAISPSGEVQALRIDGNTSLFKIESDITGLVGLGAYLDGNGGVQVDCMSMRGNSGIGHRKMSLPLTARMRGHIDYDLIILEYGINALSGEQTEYSSYGVAMTRTVERIKACYPNADIIIMGIADRGIKEGTEVLSLPTCPAMVHAQRDVARRTGCLFWDTREAMGGDGAIVEWRKRKLMNADYIHINHDGGRELAELFYQSLARAINE